MGVVHRARDSVLGRVVALKVLSADLGADDELHQRFRREAEAIGRLSHPNIVAVYDLGESDSQLYMAMELLEGDDLRRLIEHRGDIPLADRVRVLLDIAAGLGFAHSRGVVHRDIKPANILVTSDGRVKLLDFGLARVAFRETITKRGIVLGTPDYMSPEQAMGKDIDHRTDIFSAGAVFYEFLSARKPFPGKTLHSVLYNIISGEPDPLLALCPELPARLALVVHRMLVKDPKKRYGSMEDVGRDLGQIHAALRRSHGRSALPSRPAAALSPDEQRAKVRDRLKQGRAHLAKGEWARVVAEMRQALELDPTCQEAAELLWGAGKKLVAARPDRPTDPGSEARVSALLARATPGVPEEEARRALAELALVAPDDPRLTQLLRDRAHTED
jgi:eukaryotic-like serine/threonine-protein kinase